MLPVKTMQSLAATSENHKYNSAEVETLIAHAMANNEEELVLNCDDLALGVIDACRKAGYLVVVGRVARQVSISW